MGRRENMRCVGGPLAGQTLRVPFGQLRVNWFPPGKRWGDEWDRNLNGEHFPNAELVWIVYGPDRYCYQPVENGNYGDWRLVYRDTF